MRPCAPRRRVEWMGDNPPSKWIYFLGLLRVFMALKTLRCCGDSSLPEQRSALRAINTLNPTNNTSASSGGYCPSTWCIGAEHKASCGELGGCFCRRRPWLWRLWCQLCFVLRLLKKNTKISWWLPKSLFITIYCKTYCNSYIANGSVARARVVAWPEPKPLWSNGPRHIGYRRKALVIARMINAL